MKKTAALLLVLFLACIALEAGPTILSTLNGGTGVSNPSAHGVMIGEGSSPMNVVGGGGVATTLCLEGGGTGVDPGFSTCPISGGTTGGGYAWGGSQTDGAITADGSTTIRCLGAAGTHFTIASSYLQVTDCNATTFVVNDGVTIFTVGHRIFASTSLTVGGGTSGTIRNNGQTGGTGGNASGATAGGAGAAGAMDQSS
ncbi:MAG TPA: hypothetical protein VKT80_10845, partial [Chloroflexota bacterium]|nr:hypothetical protein [Chloroflexota bacterium]